MRGVWMAAVLAVGLGLAPARAAEIETAITPEMAEIGCTLRLSGPLAVGDAARLARAMAEVPVLDWADPAADLTRFLRNFSPAVDYGDPFFTHRLCLDSAGGAWSEAVRLAALIRDHAARSLTGLPTAVARGDRCAGACAAVFLAGRFVRFPGHPHYDGAGAANALLHPLGRLDLRGLVPPGETGRAAELAAMAADGRILLPPALLAEAIGGGAAVETLGQALRWGIEVEPNPVHLGQSPGTDAELAANLCRHAAGRAPPFLALAPRAGGGWEDRISGRAYDCHPVAGFPAPVRAFLAHRVDPAAPRPRLRYACALPVEFQPARPCEGFGCETAVALDLPCLAVLHPDLPLSALAVPLR